MLQVHTFIGKSSLEGLHQMDTFINEWLSKNDVDIKQVSQCFGQERHHGQNLEPVLITCVWYEKKPE
jgi:hypothetical protein